MLLRDVLIEAAIAVAVKATDVAKTTTDIRVFFTALSHSCRQDGTDFCRALEGAHRSAHE